MKKIVSLFAAIVMTVGIMSAMPLTVNAASKSSSEGVDVSVKTDTNTYTVDEEKQLTATEVQITVSAKNSSIYDVYDADVTIDLPKGLSLKSGELNATDVDLTAGKSYKATVVAVKANTQSGNGTEEDDKPSDTPDTNKDTTDKDNPNSPKTGDDFDAGTFVALMIISGASVMLILKRYGLVSKKAVSLVVCLIMATSVMPIRAFAAESKSDKNTITVDETVTIDDQDYVIKATISFVSQTNKGSEAESYYSENSEVLRVIDAKQSEDVMTESEAIKFFKDRGFTDNPVTYRYSMEGVLYDDEVEADGKSSVKHPRYNTIHTSENGDVWNIFLINGEIFANPVSFNLESELPAQLLFSESKTLTSYKKEANKFFVTIPKESAVIVKCLDRIDAETLENLTIEVIEKL